MWNLSRRRFFFFLLQISHAYSFKIIIFLYGCNFFLFPSRYFPFFHETFRITTAELPILAPKFCHLHMISTPFVTPLFFLFSRTYPRISSSRIADFPSIFPIVDSNFPFPIADSNVPSSSSFSSFSSSKTFTLDKISNKILVLLHLTAVVIHVESLIQCILYFT